MVIQAAIRRGLRSIAHIEMATLSAEVLQAMAQAVAMALQQAGVVGGHGASGERRKNGQAIDTRGVRFREFDGNLTGWESWAHAFKCAVRAANPKALELMEEVEGMTVDAKDSEVIGEVLEDAGDVAKMSGELYSVLSQYCSGEALTVVRSVSTFEGLWAWQKLHRKYSPRTMARAIRLMADVAGPRPVKELQDVETALSTWEEKTRRLEAEFGERLSDGMRIAIATSMLPHVIQDYVYTNIDENSRYTLMAEKVRSWVGNKVAMMQGPTPMDVGEVGGDWGHAEDEWPETDVQGVGASSQCHRCGGWGHFARDCATEKGTYNTKGKGQPKGKGKGKGEKGGKGGAGGKGGGQKGGKGGAGGKGYQGTCWTCGVVGHKSNECQAWAAQGVDLETTPGAEVAQVDADVGGIWMIGSVDAGTTSEDHPPPPPGLGSKGWCPCRRGSRFRILAEEEEESEERNEEVEKEGHHEREEHHEEWRLTRTRRAGRKAKEGTEEVPIGAVERSGGKSCRGRAA